MRESRRIDRILEIFIISLKGEEFSVRELADKYQCSTKTVYRDINEVRIFLSEHMEEVEYADIIYDKHKKMYVMKRGKELLNERE